MHCRFPASARRVPGGFTLRRRGSVSRWLNGGHGSGGSPYEVTRQVNEPRIEDGGSSVITWTAPGALWLLLGVPLVWLAQYIARTNFNPSQRRIQAATRSLMLAALAVALARPVATTSSDRQSIVYVVDVSHSVSSRAIEDAARKIDTFNEGLR